jgi:prepilin-type N-terminal cleavage/methylation domain-containing protein
MFRTDHQRGVTLFELLVTLAIISIVTAFAVPARRATQDRAAVSAASRELSLLLATAREVAVARGAAAVHLDSAEVALRLTAPGTDPTVVGLGEMYGVTLTSTRDSLAFDAGGLGRGAANLRVVLARGHARDTVVVSRLGRVR